MYLSFALMGINQINPTYDKRMYIRAKRSSLTSGFFTYTFPYTNESTCTLMYEACTQVSIFMRPYEWEHWKSSLHPRLWTGSQCADNVAEAQWQCREVYLSEIPFLISPAETAKILRCKQKCLVIAFSHRILNS